MADLIKLSLQVYPDSSGTVVVYANTAFDDLPYGYLENVLERVEGVERVRVRRYSIELEVAVHAFSVYLVAIAVSTRLIEEKETLAMHGYETDVTPIFTVPVRATL